MTYDEFLQSPAKYIDDIATLLIIKTKYDMDYTEEEKVLFHHMRTYWGEMKVNQFRHQLEKCWRIKL